MRDIHCPPRNRREAIRNIVISQRNATKAFLRGENMEFSLETSRGFGVGYYSGCILEPKEPSNIRHRVMMRLFLEKSRNKSEFSEDFYSQMIKFYRETYPVIQSDVSMEAQAA